MSGNNKENLGVSTRVNFYKRIVLLFVAQINKEEMGVCTNVYLDKKKYANFNGYKSKQNF